MTDRTISTDMARLIKGMLARGDNQSDIAAYQTVGFTQMKRNEKVEASWAKAMAALKTHHETMCNEGVVTEEGIQLHFSKFAKEDRKLVVHELKKEGLSNRQIAEAVKADEKTIRNDLAEKSAKSAENSAPYENPVPTPRTKAEKRAVREAELAAKQTALPSKRYGVILADPEWRFEPYSRETGMDRAADNHYPTNSIEVISQRDIASIAADDCVLFLWATVPMLLGALEVMKAWGFEYKSHAMWDKVHIGTGYWFRNRHELLLVGTRGSIPAPAMGDQFQSVITIARKEHSAKPDQFLEMIEQYFPTLPKIELNRRGPARPGWDAWGNEATLQAAE